VAGLLTDVSVCSSKNSLAFLTLKIISFQNMNSTNTKRHRYTAYWKHPLSKFCLEQDVLKMVPHVR